MRTSLPVDDFPDFLLEGFTDHRDELGNYPSELWVCPLLAQIMGARPGLWRPDDFGVWHWNHNLSASSLDGMDEFGCAE